MARKKEVLKESEEGVEEAEKKTMEIFEERSEKMKNEVLEHHMGELSKMLSEMLDGYKKELEERIKNLGSIREEGLSGLLSKTAEIQVGAAENTGDSTTTLDIPIGEKTHAFSLTPMTRYKIFIIALPSGEVVAPPAPEEPAPEAPAPEEAAPEEAPPEAPAEEAPAPPPA
jgi:gas vesicle protein